MINLSHDHVVQKNARKNVRLFYCSRFIFIIIYYIFCHVFDLIAAKSSMGGTVFERGVWSVECGVWSVGCSNAKRRRSSVERRRSSVEHRAFECRASSVRVSSSDVLVSSVEHSSVELGRSSVERRAFQHRGSGIKHRVLMFECQVLSVKHQS
jgi:hypothetical protein